MRIVFDLLLMLAVGRCTKKNNFETKTVGVGVSVELTCPRKSSGSLFWIRIDSGDFPEVLRKTFSLKSNDRITATEERELFVQHIQEAKLSDAAVYYCIQISQQNFEFLTQTDLRVEDTLVPVTTVPLGESVTFTCALPNIEYSRERELYWFKQNAGETLTLIVTLVELTKPEFAPEFSDSRLEVKSDNNLITLTIRRTNPEDEGMYHCLITARYSNPVWSGTYLLLKGTTQRTSNYSVQWPTLSDPAPPGNSMTLQCSVLSKSENKKCPEDLSVFWFRAGSDQSRPSFIYTDGRRQDECEKLPYTQKSCFSKNFSSSDAGTYYCAVATCGEILFGDVTKLKTEDSLCNLQTYNIYLLCGISAISLIVISVLIHAIKKSKCECDHNKDAVSLQDYFANMNAKRNDDQWIYSTVIYTVMKTSIGGTRDKKASKRERIYAAAKTF